ncbi:MAG: TnpV protein [Longicatena sp.]|uniref:TnpV protein n=1 Tax=Anaerorhabdus sp. TaxID=1872524 RepID=UPI002FCB6262
MTIEYTKVGDYYFPNLKEDKQEEAQLSKYGRMKLKYLKGHQKGLFFKLQTTNQLYDYLQMIDKEANEMYEQLLIDFKKQRNITEELKEKDQIKWVQEMNNIQNCIDEIIRKKVIEL